MIFNYGGDEFRIEFERTKKPITVPDQFIVGEFVTVPSRHPYTTVRILQKDRPTGNYKIHRTATVGCWKQDPFNLEAGRVGALRLVSKGKSLSKEFKAVMWETYINRKGAGKVQGHKKIKVEEPT